MSARWLVSRLVFAVGVLMAFWCTPALAGLTHPLLSSFGSFSDVQGVAVDQATGDVYVLDTGAGEGSLLKFDASGKPMKFTGLPGEPLAITGLHGGGGSENELAVDSSTGPAKGDIYVAASSSNGEQIDVIAPDGKSLGVLNESIAPWGETCGVAVDPAGNVYVGVYGGYVDKFVPTANPVTNSDYTSSIVGANAPCNLAADTHGNVFTAKYGGGPVERYEASLFGELTASGSIVDATGSTLAVDPTDNHVYVDTDGEVSEFGASGEPFEAPLTIFGQANAESFGIAINETSGDIYVSDGNGKVSVYGPEALLPDASVQTAPVVTAESATLDGTVNPGGLPVNSCRFEYGAAEEGLTDSSPCTSIPGSGNVAEAVSARLTGLTPDTYYHYRLSATNANGSAHSQEASFTTSGPLGLPDNRGYEKVSSNNNADGNVYPPSPEIASSESFWTELPFVAAADGNALTYVAEPSETGGDGFEGPKVGNQYLATRAPGGGWSAANVTPPSEEFFDTPAYQGFSANLSMGFVSAKGKIPLVQGAPSGGYGLPYVRDLETGSYEALLMSPPPNRTPSTFKAYQTPLPTPVNGSGSYPAFAGASSDFKHVLYMENDALTANAVDGGPQDNNLYDAHEGALSLVNVLPNGTPEPNATFGGPVIEPDSRRYNSPALSNVISTDGRRIFWTGLGDHNLYVRENGTTTVQVDAAVGGEGQFWTATSTGSKVLFTKDGDLYEYEVENARTTDLTPGAEVQGVSGTSEDLSYIYFVANAALASGAEQQHCIAGEANTTECNLYALHVGGSIRFIGALSGTDDASVPNSFDALAGAWQGSLATRETQVTADGRYLLFGSRMPLTAGSGSGKPSLNEEQIFLYDYSDAHLTCVSCGRTGESVALGTHTASYLPISNLRADSHRWMSEDGNRVFFNSERALVLQDTNGVNDVYEWERDGTGSCELPTNCIFLVSSGTGSEGAFLMDIDTTGDNVFFSTRANLALGDENETIDAYDARVGAPVTPGAPQCTGTGCQGVPSAPPVFATPASVTYAGVGNFAASAKTTVPKAKAQTKKHARHGSRKKSKRKSRKAKRASKARRASRTGQSYGRSK